MKKHTGLSIIIGGLVIVVLFAAYVSYKSYSNIGVGDDPKVETTEKTPAQHKQNANKYSKKNDHPAPKPSKKDSNIFLQDTKNPDRIIAIHPYGSKGIYLYRKQADGSIYPEYKYYNGSVSTNKKNLTVKHSDHKGSNGFNFKIQPNKTYKESDSGKTFTKVANVSAPKATNSTKKDSNSVDPRYAYDSVTNTLKAIVTDKSDPTLNSNSSSLPSLLENHDYHTFARLKNGDYYDPISNIFYGKNLENFTTDDFLNSPSTYIDSNYDMSQNVMYYKQNNATEVSNDELQESLYYYHTKSGNGYSYKAFPKLNDRSPAHFDDRLPHHEVSN